MENIEKKVLESSLTKELADSGYQLDQKALDIIYASIKMDKRAPDPNTSTRTISGEVDSDGNISYESFKLYNLSQISMYDSYGFLKDNAGVLLFEDNLLKLILGVGALIYDFYPKMGRKFIGRDARLIYGMKQLEKNFTQEELLFKYHELFPEKTILLDDLRDSLTVLKEARVIRDAKDGSNKLELIEKIKNLVRV